MLFTFALPSVSLHFLSNTIISRNIVEIHPDTLFCQSGTQNQRKGHHSKKHTEYIRYVTFFFCVSMSIKTHKVLFNAAKKKFRTLSVFCFFDVRWKFFILRWKSFTLNAYHEQTQKTFGQRTF